MKITSILGNSQRLDGGAMFGNAPRSVWETWMPPDEEGRIELACRCLLVETDSQKILCETGIGAFFPPKLAQRFGVGDPSQHKLLENLKKIGVSPESIDWVILSHLHFDHAGGLLPLYSPNSASSELVFPRAQFAVGKEALARAMNPHMRDRASFIADLPEKLRKSGRLVVVDGELIPGLLEDRLSLLYSDGHTPGQMHVLIRGDIESVLFCGDLIPGQHWIHTPITMGYDRYAELVIDEKSDLYQRAIAEKWLLFFTHDPNHAISKVKYLESDKSPKVIPWDLETECLRRPI